MPTLRDMAKRPGLEPVHEVLALNPGLSLDANEWTYGGFKGGSEPGVLNLTWLLQRADRRWSVLTAGFSNSAGFIDENSAIRALQAALGRLL